MVNDLRSAPISTLSRAASRSPLVTTERPLPLLGAQRIAAAAAADGVELVDEHDARLVAPCVAEHLPDARGADARVHLDEIRTAREEKRHLRFAGDRAREQRLARSRRAD